MHDDDVSSGSVNFAVVSEGVAGDGMIFAAGDDSGGADVVVSSSHSTLMILPAVVVAVAVVVSGREKSSHRMPAHPDQQQQQEVTMPVVKHPEDHRITVRHSLDDIVDLIQAGQPDEHACVPVAGQPLPQRPQQHDEAGSCTTDSSLLLQVDFVNADSVIAAAAGHTVVAVAVVVIGQRRPQRLQQHGQSIRRI